MYCKLGVKVAESKHEFAKWHKYNGILMIS